MFVERYRYQRVWKSLLGQDGALDLNGFMLNGNGNRHYHNFPSRRCQIYKVMSQLLENSHSHSHLTSFRVLDSFIIVW